MLCAVNDKERQEYERLMQEQSAKDGKMPFKTQLKMDFQVFCLLLFVGSFIAARITRGIMMWIN